MDMERIKREVQDNVGSFARDHLANEHTFLAWVRTALAVIGLGVLFGKLIVWLCGLWSTVCRHGTPFISEHRTSSSFFRPHNHYIPTTNLELLCPLGFLLWFHSATGRHITGANKALVCGVRPEVQQRAGRRPSSLLP